MHVAVSSDLNAEPSSIGGLYVCARGLYVRAGGARHIQI